ncbi:endonuclease/exonuclease/phosphatase family protein [Mesobacillus maritimus]|uniref:endonuclease/exonuclease/phosphatase family protein n=1 Tax=Mesobacillus maritimus TaxID=1643336 RepID=UPI00203D70E5|nr:endonuclease/exonuclease/phosphatase family protein [Mesobacillus maritimus]MCM3668312.1 endonuclease/exonuclease/phosphatase family protein [Mesobacillus maritimus]
MSSIMIGSYNIHMETPMGSGELWKDRRENVLQVLQDYDFDLIGLQEVSGNQLRDLGTLTAYDYFGNGRSFDENNEYNPILYKKTNLDLLQAGTFWLSETLSYEEGEKSWEAQHPRICTWGHFQVKATGKEFYLFNTHFDRRSEEARYHSAKLLLEQTALVRESENPIFIVGDLNGTEAERFYVKLRSKFVDVVKKSPHHIGPKVTCTMVGFNHERSWDHYQRIDYIFASPHIKINRTQIITDQFNRKYPSDHFPVSLEATF